MDTYGMIIYLVVIVGAMYLMVIRPQRKQQKTLNAMLAQLAIGDSVMTSGGFYGVVIDVTEDMVIVEFGSNKNCRIPMDKKAISNVEKPETAAEA